MSEIRPCNSANDFVGTEVFGAIAGWGLAVGEAAADGVGDGVGRAAGACCVCAACCSRCAVTAIGSVEKEAANISSVTSVSLSVLLDIVSRLFILDNFAWRFDLR